MRNELELIEKIELYINGTMSASERMEFEKEMNSDDELKASVQQQRDLVNGVGRISLKQQVVKAGRGYHWKRNITRLTVSGAIVVLTAVAVWFVFGRKPHDHEPFGRNIYKGNTLPAYNEEGTTQWAMADSVLKGQVFRINGNKDTVIETKNGMVLSIPSEAFRDKSGNIIKNVSLYIKEALDPADMLLAGLTTWAGDGQLETGGMFFIDARNGEEPLSIDSTKGIIAVLPNSASKPDMQLFKGKRMPNGSIDWTAPKPLINDLIAVDIHRLDFIPGEFNHVLSYEMVQLNKDQRGNDKKFIDSFYFSFARLFHEPHRRTREITEREVTIDDKVYADTVFVSDSSSLICCGINPAKVQAIWNDRFQGTLLATKAFEERMRYIHDSRNPAILDLYINNLDKNMYEIDEMAAPLYKGHYEGENPFKRFAALKQGKVKNGVRQFDNLKKYYTMKTKLLTESIAKTEAAFTKKQEELRELAASNQSARLEDSIKRYMENFVQEFTINLESAYKQLGYEKPTVVWQTIPPQTNMANVTATGWYNVDRYVMEATISRTSMKYTDPVTGKTAELTYTPFSAQINNMQQYDKVMVYLIPDKLSSIMDVKNVDGIFKENLNALINYQLVCIGLKDGKRFLCLQKEITPKAYKDIDLAMVTDEEFRKKLQFAFPAGQSYDQIDWQVERQILSVADDKRRIADDKMEGIVASVINALFSCNDSGESNRVQKH